MADAISEPTDRQSTGRADYWSAPEDVESLELARLVNEIVGPVAFDVVTKLLGCAHGQASAAWLQDREDLIATCRASVIKAIRQAKAEGRSIENLHGYTHRAASHVFDAYLREKKPAYWGVFGSINDICKRSADTGISKWEIDADTVIGYVTWREHRLSLDLQRVQRLKEGIESNTMGALFPHTTRHRRDLLVSILDWSKHPLPFALVARSMCALLGIDELPIQTLGEVDICGQLPGPDTLAGLREYLRVAWREITDLPLRQRVALLLNLYDRQGANVIALLPLAQIAGISEIASALEMPVEELLSIWDQFPMEDKDIARRLGATTLQVTNLRSVARARLQRRMAAAGFGA